MCSSCRSRSPDVGLYVEECVSCLSLFVSLTGAELCCLWLAFSPSLPLYVPSSHSPERETPPDRAGLQVPDLCAVYTLHKPPDILTISLGAPHS
ncbi:hypothetical protein PBY51_012474 [Eleginops maclovinus]|uniref:Uncharacterized protein n=1 Tax=Eleginops maclovinus TaxID=56733 RepID=A0AAN7XVG8_ELEMC|nr:hypothetical protein PBY51_012474 [Eleginops maclovinus]